MSIAITEDHRALADTAADFLAKHEPAARPGPCSRRRRGPAAVLGRARRPRLARPARPRGARRLGLRPRGAGRRGRGARPGRRPRAVRADRHRQRGARRGRRRRRGRAATCPAWPTARPSAPSPSAGDVDRQRRHAPRAPPASCSAAGWPTCCSWPPATTSRSSTPSATASPSRCPANLDPTRRTGPRHPRRRARRPCCPARAGSLVDLARVILAAEAVGIARECTEHGRRLRQGARAVRPPDRHVPGGQAPLRQHARGHRAGHQRGVGRRPGRRRPAATSSPSPPPSPPRSPRPAADLCANLNIQVHGGIASPGSTTPTSSCAGPPRCWATSTPDAAAAELTDLTRQGVVAGPHASSCRPRPSRSAPRCGAFAERIKGLPAEEQRTELIETGYVMPHWPKPWGRDAGAVEQLVIEQEFAAAGVTRPPTASPAGSSSPSIQHATDDQVARWVRPALNQDVIWCQLFSEPDAGSDAAGVKTKATRVDGGWLVNGQKVWTSGAHVAGVRPRHRAHQPRRPQARRHHHDGDRHARRGRRGAAAEDDRPAARSSTRCSSTTCSCPTTTWSGRSTAAGPWPGPRSATRA